MGFKYMVFICAVLFLIFLLYKEISRKNRSNLWLRLCASVIAVVCFVLFIFPISYQIKQTQFANEAILITDGFNPDSIVKLSGKKYSVITTEDTIAGVKHITDLNYFLATNPQLNQFRVFGYGLDEGQLKYLFDKKIDFHPVENLTGIITCNWNKTLNPTVPLLVQGMYQNTGDHSIKLVMKGFGRQLDSVIIKENSTQQFSFTNQPKQIGKTTYQLISLREKDTISVEPVPFEVIATPMMKVLILASSPDFEYKFLRNWLYENHYPIAIRTKISKEKFSSDFLNLDRFDINRLNKRVLQSFDALIIDEDELNQVSLGEKAIINEAVINGLGIFIRLSSLKENVITTTKFERYEVPLNHEKTLQLQLLENKFKFSALPVVATMALKTNEGDQHVVSDLKNHILVKANIKGRGKVLSAVMPATYHWMLSGNKEDYQIYWSGILKTAARKKIPTNTVQILPDFPFSNEKTRVVVEQSQNNQPQIKFENKLLSPRQNMELPFKWDAELWPKNPGWQELNVNGSNYSFFVYQKKDWQTYKNNQKLKATLNLHEKSKTIAKNITGDESLIEKKLSIWYILVVFLLSMGFLWYESRVLANQ